MPGEKGKLIIIIIENSVGRYGAPAVSPNYRGLSASRH